MQEFCIWKSHRATDEQTKANGQQMMCLKAWNELVYPVQLTRFQSSCELSKKIP